LIGELYINAAELFPVGSWKGIEMLFQRPYWTRLWIIQEIALSHGEIVFICGEQFLDWRTLIDALSILLRDPDLLFELHCLDRLATGEKVVSTARSQAMIRTISKAIALHLMMLGVTVMDDVTDLSLADILTMVRSSN
jgi:hypothetical protein